MQSILDKRFTRMCAVSAIAIVCLTACGSSSLVGEYSTTEGGQAELIVKRSGGETFASVLEGNSRWSKPEKLVECSEKDYAAIFGANWREIKVRGLRNSSGFAVFRVQKGAVHEGHTFKTGYFMFFVLGGGDLYRL